MKAMNADEREKVFCIFDVACSPQYDEDHVDLRGIRRVYIYSPDWKKRFRYQSIATTANERKALLLNGYHIKFGTPRDAYMMACLRYAYERS